VQDCLENDVLSGAIERNQEYSMAWVSWNGTAFENTAEKNLQILYDPQTSGGLLVALPEENAREFVQELQARGHTATSVFGRFAQRPDPDCPVQVRIVNENLGNFHGRRRAVSSAKIDRIPIQFQSEGKPMKSERENDSHVPEASCCSGGAESGHEGAQPSAAVPGGDTADNTLLLFTEFMKAANAPGLIDARAKKLMAIALSIAHHCEPCLKIHLKSALAMGIPKAELDEAANLAIAFGGCTAMMFYKETCKDLGI
jgi:AhpD family alkylhydroperoxidase